MKIKKRFVSNSSSTAFILNLADADVKGLVEKIDLPSGLNRCSAIAVGKRFTHYIDTYRKDIATYYTDEKLTNWMQEWNNKLGEDTVFIRSSGEGMGGYVPEMSGSETCGGREGVSLMKMRRRFVSNSSSSSFIMIFDDKNAPDHSRTIEETFDWEWSQEKYKDDYTSRVAWTVFGDWWGKDMALRYVKPGEKIIFDTVEQGEEYTIREMAEKLGAKIYWKEN